MPQVAFQFQTIYSAVHAIVPPSESEVGKCSLTTQFQAFKLLITLGDRLMVGLQSLDLPIGVRIPVSQPIFYGRLA
jgi:hypothetical protein